MQFCVRHVIGNGCFTSMDFCMHTQFLSHEGERIATMHHTQGALTFMFLPGFRSDMRGAKATAMAEWCKENGHSFLSLDYRAHGESSGDFRQFTIGGGLSDALAVLDATTGPVIVIGSSMGGWIGLRMAQMRKERVVGLIGIAAAPDFTERLMWQKMSEEKRRHIEEDGEIRLPSAYGIGEMIYTHALIVEGREHLLLDDAIALSLPVRLLQGMQDEDVPWHTALDIAEKLASDNVQIHLIKDGDHRLSREEDLHLLQQVAASLAVCTESHWRLAA